MKQMGAFEAKTHFSELLAAVSKGEEFAITRHGQMIALLVPYSKGEKESSAKQAVEAIKKLRRGIKLGKGLSIKKMRAQGRK